MTEGQADRAAYHRARDLEWIASRFLGGKETAETLRTGTPCARELAIQGLENLAYAWSQMSHARHWAYSHPKHMHLCRIIERERTLLATDELQAARRKHQAAVRHIRHHLHRRGWAPLSLLRRLGTARGALLAAIAGPCSREDAR
jgi:hypothetical protein